MLDLTKLKALQYPTKNITVNIAGDDQIVKIQALNDEVSVQIAMLGDQPDSPENILKLHHAVLKNGVCDISDEDVVILCQKAMPTVMILVAEIRDLTMEFATARKQTAEDAKKN